ncbi:MAG TPA: histidinol-phosphatase HisJ family protein [Armatimonadota bacterium]|nr:histidinol-phosphatase HisJ family protein [Armatimonadota bacterium]HOS42826.1 histidinol-phosphatase HisJ family protein [Armatimonadota bacterium]
MIGLRQASQLDDHVHSTAGSADARDSMMALCARAVALGLRRVCFTEHVDYDVTLPEYGYFDFARVRRAWEEARSAYAGRLEVRLGLEVDFRPAFLARMCDDLPRYAVDVVLGAVHSYGGRHLLDVRADKATWAPEELGALYAAYFRDLRLLIETGVIDSLAHFDYPYKLGLRPAETADIPGYEEELTATLALAIARGVAIEVNTKGADTGTPLAASAAILRRYRELGGTRVTLGSDAHRAADLGGGLAVGAAALRAAGFTHVTTYRARAAERVPLEEQA